MKCKFCEEEISDDLLKCIYCGNTVQTEEERDKRIRAKSKAEKLAKESADSISLGDVNKAGSDNEHKEKRKMLIVLLLALFVSGGIALFSLGRVHEPSVNDNNQGKTAEDQQDMPTKKEDEGTEKKDETGGNIKEVPADNIVTDNNEQAEKYGSITGMVLDANSGKAVNDARVVLKSKQGKIYPDNEVRKTDEHGAFTINVPAGLYILQITKTGYTEYSSDDYLNVGDQETINVASIAMQSDYVPETDMGTGNTGEYYILPFSNSRELTNSDLDKLSEWELKLARNEIYARHGRKFKDPDLQNYFDQQSWYVARYAPDDFDKNHSSEISALEKKNAEFILKYELDHGYYT